MSSCFKWIFKTPHPTPEHNEDGTVEALDCSKVSCPFENIPINILIKILGDRSCLTVDDLKSARLVCKLWHSIISEIQLLTKKSLALAFKGDASLIKIKYSKLVPKETKKYWIFFPRLFRRKIPLHGTSFRIENSAAPLIFDWLRFFKTKNIKSLELDCSILTGNVLISCICTSLKKLERLTLTDSFVYDPVGTTQQISEFTQLSFQHLKTLNINVTHSWFYANVTQTSSRTFPIPKFFSTPHMSSLVTLTIKITDTGSSLLDQRGHFQNIFKSVGLILKYNAKTLKNVSIVTFDISNDRSYRCYLRHPEIQIYPSLAEAPSEDQNFLFDHFLEEMKVSGWLDYGLRLQKLTLAFRLLHLTRTSIIDETLRPFLKSMTSLQEISISQIFAQNREYFNEVFGYLFNYCKCHFVEVHNVKPPSEFEDEIQGKLQYYLAMNHPKPFGPFIHAFNATGKKIKALFASARPNTGWDILSELTTPNHTSIVRFSQWKSLQSVVLFRISLNFLTTIRVKHEMCNPQGNLVIEDEDLQTISRSSLLLRELHFENCNLSRVTDYGLTGISREACASMNESGIIEPSPSEFIGVPLSNLKKLRSIQLGFLSARVGDISAMFAFNGLERLDSFEMEMIHAPDRTLQELKLPFKFSREINVYSEFQYEMYEKIKV